MTPGFIDIVVANPEFTDEEFTAASVYITSGALELVNTTTWLMAAIRTVPTCSAFALAANLMQTGGDEWMSITPADPRYRGDEPVWKVQFDWDVERWIITPPEGLINTPEPDLSGKPHFPVAKILEKGPTLLFHCWQGAGYHKWTAEQWEEFRKEFVSHDHQEHQFLIGRTFEVR